MSYRTRAADGRMHFRGASLDEYARTGPLGIMAQRRGVVIPPTSRVADVPAILAILNDDQWIALCPDCGRNAQMVWLDQPLFFCGACFNVTVGGLWRRVSLPTEARRHRIEEITGHRKFTHERNWRGESLTALRRENVKQGDPLPDGGG